MDDVFESPHPSLVKLQKSLGENHARAVVVLLLTEAMEAFNISEPMNDTQIAIATDMIIEEYPHFKTDDLKLCFKNAIKGKYGNVYNRIDVQIVMGWLKKYNIDRCNRADEVSYKEHQSRLQTEQTEGFFYEDYRKMLKKRASSGDKEAKDALERSNSFQKMVAQRKLERRKKELKDYEALRNKVDEQK